MPPVGVIALQGGVREHVSILLGLGCSVIEVRRPEHLSSVSALFLPGGESTTLISLLDRWGLIRPLRELGRSGLPMFGTCAGAVLLSGEVAESEHEVEQESLSIADVRAVRNYFGRQRKSFVEMLSVTGLDEAFRGIFIRAPLLVPLSENVQVLSRVEDGPVFLRQDNLWLSSFHPELTSDSRIHRMFLEDHGILERGSDAHI